MKTILNCSSSKKSITAALALITLSTVLVTTLFFSATSREHYSVDAVKLVQAARSYARILTGQELPVPATVSVRELIAQGLLKETDVSGFRGMVVTINLAAKESHPHDVLVRAVCANGDEIVALGDGSVQQVHKQTRLGSLKQ
jgi:hypothetical protein